MKNPVNTAGVEAPDRSSACRDESDASARAVYVPPRLERLGAWKALTLQQSIGIFP